MQTCYTTLPNTQIVIQEFLECPKRKSEYEKYKAVSARTSNSLVTWTSECVTAYYDDGTYRIWYNRKSKAILIKETIQEFGSFLQFLPNGGIYKRTIEWDCYWGPENPNQPSVDGNYEVLYPY